jgi:hypothetical protein
MSSKVGIAKDTDAPDSPVIPVVNTNDSLPNGDTSNKYDDGKGAVEEEESEFQIVRLLQAFRKSKFAKASETRAAIDKLDSDDKEGRKKLWSLHNQKNEEALCAYKAYKEFLEDRAVGSYEDMMKGHVSGKCKLISLLVSGLQSGLSFYVVRHSAEDDPSEIYLAPFAVRIVLALAIVGHVSAKFMSLVENISYHTRSRPIGDVNSFSFFYYFFWLQCFSWLFTAAVSAIVCFNSSELYDALKDCTALLVINDLEDFVFTTFGFLWFESKQEMDEYKRVSESNGFKWKMLKRAAQSLLIVAAVVFGYFLSKSELSKKWLEPSYSPVPLWENEWDCISDFCLWDRRFPELPAEMKGSCLVVSDEYDDKLDKWYFSIVPFETIWGMCSACSYHDVVVDKDLWLYEVTNSSYINTTVPAALTCFQSDYGAA